MQKENPDLSQRSVAAGLTTDTKPFIPIAKNQNLLAQQAFAPHPEDMFTIEHEFDATVVTLVDEPASHRQEDVTINAFASCVTLEQLNLRTNQVEQVTFSMAQLRDLAAALDLPEGVYRLMPDDRPDSD